MGTRHATPVFGRQESTTFEIQYTRRIMRRECTVLIPPLNRQPVHISLVQLPEAPQLSVRIASESLTYNLQLDSECGDNMKQKSKTAIAYLRTSSAANVGNDKDSHKRQLAAIEAFARSAGVEIVAEYRDEAVSGGDAIEARPGFAAMLQNLGNVRTIIVENASRFARDLIVQETGYGYLRKLGIELIAADSPASFIDDTPTSRLIRQVLGAVAEFEKAALVAKLKGARDRKRHATGKCGGRRSHAEARPDTVALARRLRRQNPVSHERMSLGRIAAELERLGHRNANGRRYAAQSIRSMVAG